MQQIKIHMNLKAGTTYTYLPHWISNAMGFRKGEKVWIKLEGNKIIIQRKNLNWTLK